MPFRSDDCSEARHLCSSVAVGSVQAWHAFVERYSALILSVVRRYLPRESEDEWRTVYVDVLCQLRDGKLEAYDGSSALSTWVTLITRRACIDYLRHAYGRKGAPKWLEALPELERQVYHLYYLEGLGYDEICERLSTAESRFEAEDLAAALAHLEERMTRPLRRRLAYDLQAREVGVLSGRMLEFLDELRLQNAERAERLNPEHQLEQSDQEARIEKMHAFLQEIPQLEREVLERFYYQDWTAKRIASHFGLADQRRAYTMIARALARLRRRFDWEIPGGALPTRDYDATPRTQGAA